MFVTGITFCLLLSPTAVQAAPAPGAACASGLTGDTKFEQCAPWCGPQGAKVPKAKCARCACKTCAACSALMPGSLKLAAFAGQARAVAAASTALPVVGGTTARPGKHVYGPSTAGNRRTAGILSKGPGGMRGSLAAANSPASSAAPTGALTAGAACEPRQPKDAKQAGCAAFCKARDCAKFCKCASCATCGSVGTGAPAPEAPKKKAQFLAAAPAAATPAAAPATPATKPAASAAAPAARRQKSKAPPAASAPEAGVVEAKCAAWCSPERNAHCPLGCMGCSYCVGSKAKSKSKSAMTVYEANQLASNPNYKPKGAAAALRTAATAPATAAAPNVPAGASGLIPHDLPHSRVSRARQTAPVKAQGPGSAKAENTATAAKLQPQPSKPALGVVSDIGGIGVVALGGSTSTGAAVAGVVLAFGVLVSLAVLSRLCCRTAFEEFLSTLSPSTSAGTHL